jgi:ABC-type multidrug transport system fused ATPase/permease subunit
MIRSVGAIEQKFKALSELDEIVSPAEDFSTEGIKMDIKLDQVSLSIKGNPILHNINITFEHGKKYLVLGSNGSGKSTMAKLLKNTYSGYEGSIMLDTYDLATPEGASLIRLVSYSNETVSLLSDTVRNNILLYRDVSDDRLETAVRLAGLRVPMNRKAGDGGRFLSSGERRKLELARALIDDPQVMILDEVVSTLDIETAYEIEKLVLSLEDRTVIMISNAFSGQLLDQYDQIVLMNQGSILAQGTHSELIQNSDEYREIYRIRCGDI